MEPRLGRAVYPIAFLGEVDPLDRPAADDRSDSSFFRSSEKNARPPLTSAIRCRDVATISAQDRGVLVLLDNRVMKQRYGKVFLDSLPDYAFSTDIADVARFFDVSVPTPGDPWTARLDLPVGEHGEIWLRTPQLMKGFLNKPEATAEVLVGLVEPAGRVVAVDDRVTRGVEAMGPAAARGDDDLGGVAALVRPRKTPVAGSVESSARAVSIRRQHPRQL